MNFTTRKQERFGNDRQPLLRPHRPSRQLGKGHGREQEHRPRALRPVQDRQRQRKALRPRDWKVNVKHNNDIEVPSKLLTMANLYTTIESISFYNTYLRTWGDNLIENGINPGLLEYQPFK